MAGWQDAPEVSAKSAAWMNAPEIGQKPGQEPSSYHALINAISNGGTFNLMAPVAAGLGALTQEGDTSHAPTFGQRYDENLAKYRGQDQATASAHPVVNIAGQLAGGVMNPVTRALPVAKTVLGAIGQGAAIGGAYGAGAAVTNQDSAGNAAKEIGEGALLGGAVPAVVSGISNAPKLLPAVLGNVTTGAGANAVRGAYDAGVQGGEQGAAFLSNLRGDTNWRDVVDQAKDALGNMRAQRNAAYRSGMVDISNDKTVLDFAPIQKAMDDAANMQTFKGQSLGGAAEETKTALNGAINNWAKLDPAEYHTPEGLDFLKQQVGEVLADTKPNTAASIMAGKVYNAVKSAIQEQAPTYAKVMSDYSDASDAVNDIQRELSLGSKGNPATALRKLQSVMRDNVNTSWGQRADYAKTLAENGADTLMPSLSGQALSSVMPRGLAKYGDATVGALAYGLGHGPAALATLPLMSPRVVGEGAYGLGKIVGSLPKLGGLSTAGVSRAVSAPSISALVPAMLQRLK